MGYLTPKQKQVWRLKSEGYTEASIGRKLKISRQIVHKAINVANRKIRQSLEETANINKIEIQTVSPTQGYLTGYSPHFNTNAFVTYSPRNGIQICYDYEGNCTKCQRKEKCREILIQKTENQNLILMEDINQMPPSKLAQALFSSREGQKKNE